MVLVVLAALVTVGWYLKNGALRIEGEFSQMEGGQPSVPKISVAPRVMKHLIFLGGILERELRQGQTALQAAQLR